MRLVIFGLTVSSSWGNGHATIWRGLCRALGDKGHEVTFFERDVPYYRIHRDLFDPPHYRLVIYPEWSAVELCAKEALAHSDCAIVTSYCPDAQAAAELICDSSAHINIFYDLDTPVTLNVLKSQGTVDYLPKGGLGKFDLVLSYTGGKTLDELKRQLGAKKVAPLYGCADPASHKRVPQQSHYSSDLSYLGTYAADRQSQLEELFLKPAKRQKNKKFCIAGALYPADFPWSQNIFFVRHLAPTEHSAFYSSSSLTLNITRSAMARMGYAPSGRLFEAAACETPILSDWWEGLDVFFEPGKEILCVEQSSETEEALNLDTKELAKIATAAKARVLAEHTAAHRAAELVNLVEAIA